MEHIEDILVEIKKDCLMLKKRKELTDFGLGQLYLIKIIEDAKINMNKYSIDDLKSIPKTGDRIAQAFIFVANELNFLNRKWKNFEKITPKP